MSYSLPFLASPYPWVFFAGMFCGAALNRALRSARYPRWRASDPERARTAKWMFFTLYLSLAVVAGLGAVFVPGPQKILDRILLFFFAGSILFFFLVFRFKRTIGVVSVLALILLVVTVLLLLHGLTAFSGETEIGRVRVLDSSDGDLKLEIIPTLGQAEIIGMKGSYFAPIVKVVIFDDAFVFLGAKSWYRFEGMTSFAAERSKEGVVLRQQDTDYYFAAPAGISEKLWEFYERHDSRIPGVRTAQIEMDLKRARPLSTYSLRIQNDGGLEILEIY